MLPIFVEVLARFSAIGILVAICLLILLNRLKPRITLYALLFNVSVICILLASGSEEWRISPPAGFVLSLVGNLIFLFAWRFGMAVFDEDVQLGPAAGAIFAFFVFAPMLDNLTSDDHLPFVNSIIGPSRILFVLISFGLMVHLAYRAVIGRNDDLVDTRRKSRVSFAIMLAALMLLIIIMLEIGRLDPRLDINLLFLLAPVFALAMAIWTTRLHPETLAFEPVKSALEPTPLPVDPREQVVLEKLRQLMEAEYAYRQHGLTVSKLAEQMDVQERALRALINRTLGHRNFSTFLNTYRINEAKGRLSDPSEVRLPVLTIAIDAGFASISPFNAAFKSIVGATPTMYRQQAMKKTLPTTMNAD